MINITVCEAGVATFTPAEIESQLRAGVPPTWGHIQILLSPFCLCLPAKEAIYYRFVTPKRGTPSGRSALIAPYWLCHDSGGSPFPVGLSSPMAAWKWYLSKEEGALKAWSERHPLAERFYPVRDRIVSEAIEQLSKPIEVPPVAANGKKRRVAKDYYPTPERYTRPLLDRWEAWKGTIVSDPCAGRGHISNLIPGCVTNDFYPTPEFQPDLTLDLYGSELYEALRERGVKTVITNPPYGNDAPAVLLKRCWEEAEVDNIAMLLRLNFMEPCQDRRALLQELADHMRYFWPVSPRPQFRADTNGGDNVTVFWGVWERKFSWSELGIECPFNFLYCPKKGNQKR